MVDREAMARRPYCSADGTIRRAGLLWSPALRIVFHLRADGLCIGQFVYNSRDVRSVLDSSGRGSRRTGGASFSEIDGNGRRSDAFLTQPNRLRPAVSWTAGRSYGDWLNPRPD